MKDIVFSTIFDHQPGTLLNRLFGTTFDVMDETMRQQTTKGERGSSERIATGLIQLQVFGCVAGRI